MNSETEIKNIFLEIREIELKDRDMLEKGY